MKRAINMRTTSKGRKGQAIIMLTLAVPVVFGLLGLAADIGWMHYRQSKAQTAADAAAMAAVDRIIQLSAGTYGCGSGAAVCQSRTLCPATIPATPTSTLETACAYAKANGFEVKNNGTQWVYVSSGANTAPPRSAGVTTSYWVSVEVIESIPQKFAAVLGKTLGSAAARHRARGHLRVIGTRRLPARSHDCSHLKVRPRPQHPPARAREPQAAAASCTHRKPTVPCRSYDGAMSSTLLCVLARTP